MQHRIVEGPRLAQKHWRGSPIEYEVLLNSDPDYKENGAEILQKYLAWNTLCRTSTSVDLRREVRLTLPHEIGRSLSPLTIHLPGA